jgi:hypothetical protein
MMDNSPSLPRRLISFLLPVYQAPKGPSSSLKGTSVYSRSWHTLQGQGQVLQQPPTS